ncbi:MAG: 3-phosphoshikimate 1-carboxyvinyltransferase [Desulfobacteraceae bacterium]
MKEIHPKTPIDARVKMPGSKSLVHRTLIAAGLAGGESRLSGFLNCEDTLYTVSALRELGVRIGSTGEEVTVSGTGGKFPRIPGLRKVFVGNSGTSFRLLLSTAALAHGHYMFTGEPRMLERPVDGLVRALKALGVDAWCTGKDGVPPVQVRAKGVRGGKVSLEGGTSSQYISSLLLAAPYMEKGLELEIVGGLASKGYVDLTVEVMTQFGVDVLRDGYGYFKVRPRQTYGPRHFTIEGDVSSASYLWAAAAVTGGSVTTENVYPFATRQGDIDFLTILAQMGCRIDKQEDHVTVTGRGITGIEADMGDMPDMVPTLAALSLFAHGKTTIRNVPQLRLKESDRLKTMAQELSRVGGRVVELPDGLVIHGHHRLKGAVINPHNDHRIAMSLAVVGLRVPGITIEGADCVRKSFPHFWEVWDSL